MAKDDIWIKRDGTKIKMWRMTDSHLKNAIKYFKPNPASSGRGKRWRLLTEEAKRRNWEIIDNGIDIEIIDQDRPDEQVNSRFDILDL